MWTAERAVQRLRESGELWETAPGAIGLRGDALTLYRELEERIRLVAATEAAEEWAAPPVIPFEALGRADYFASFPQWLSGAGHMSDDPEVLESVARAEDPARAARSAMGVPGAALPPAACYHVYAALADRVIANPVRVTLQCTCWRHEGDRLRPLERGWAFTMREAVCLGTGADVSAFRDAGLGRALALAASLGIPARVEAATDPFFAPTGRGRMMLQRLKELKHELLLPIGTDRLVAAASFNLHESFFGEAFDIRLADGAPAASGCVAYGIERWLLAFIVAHGADARGWPALDIQPELLEV